LGKHVVDTNRGCDGTATGDCRIGPSAFAIFHENIVEVYGPSHLEKRLVHTVQRVRHHDIAQRNAVARRRPHRNSYRRSGIGIVQNSVEEHVSAAIGERARLVRGGNIIHLDSGATLKICALKIDASRNLRYGGRKIRGSTGELHAGMREPLQIFRPSDAADAVRKPKIETALGNNSRRRIAGKSVVVKNDADNSAAPNMFVHYDAALPLHASRKFYLGDFYSAPAVVVQQHQRVRVAANRTEWRILERR
jgi:hypothetical protein